MAAATFTSEQLVEAWGIAAFSTPKGTRGDVVRSLMKTMGMEDNDENYRKVYNNVTQRVKQLSQHKTEPVHFEPLAPGQKGSRRTSDQMKNLQAIMERKREEAKNKAQEAAEAEAADE